MYWRMSHYINIWYTNIYKYMYIFIHIHPIILYLYAHMCIYICILMHVTNVRYTIYMCVCVIVWYTNIYMYIDIHDTYIYICIFRITHTNWGETKRRAHPGKCLTRSSNNLIWTVFQPECLSSSQVHIAIAHSVVDFNSPSYLFQILDSHGNGSRGNSQTAMIVFSVFQDLPFQETVTSSFQNFPNAAQTPALKVPELLTELKSTALTPAW